MQEIFADHWSAFAALAAGIAVLAGFLTNVDKLHAWIKQRVRAQKERREMPQKTFDAVNALAEKVKSISEQLEKVSAETDEQSKMLGNLDADTADLLCSQLTREHDYFVKLGYCPNADKARIETIHRRYKERGRNHLSDRFLDDVIDLPSSPVTYEQT